jgi:hypothetical protein
MKMRIFIIFVCILIILFISTAGCAAKVPAPINTEMPEPTEINITAVPTEPPATPTPTESLVETVETLKGCENTGALVEQPMSVYSLNTIPLTNEQTGEISFPTLDEEGWRWVDKWGNKFLVEKSKTEGKTTTFLINGTVLETVEGSLIGFVISHLNEPYEYLLYIPSENIFVTIEESGILPFPFIELYINDGVVENSELLWESDKCITDTVSKMSEAALFCEEFPNLCEETTQETCLEYTTPNQNTYQWKDGQCPTLVIQN